jgi:hypothetical protein
METEIVVLLSKYFIILNLIEISLTFLKFFMCIEGRIQGVSVDDLYRYGYDKREMQLTRLFLQTRVSG